MPACAHSMCDRPAVDEWVTHSFSNFQVADVDMAAELAKDIGYPVMLKASAGGNS